MNRYTYKAKRKDNEEWIFGIPYHSEGLWWMLVDDNHSTNEIGTGSNNINIETLCQCTGLQDIEGNYIFENDILPINMYPDEHIENYYVVWDKNSACFDAINKDNTNYIVSTAWNKYKITGNKFDKEGDK